MFSSIHKISTVAFVVAFVLEALTLARPAAASCTGTVLYGYDATFHKVVTISLDGNATVQEVVALDPGAPTLEGIAWSPDGLALFGITGNGIIGQINLTNGLFQNPRITDLTFGQDMTPGPTNNESVASLTAHERPVGGGGQTDFWVSAITKPGTPFDEIDLRNYDPLGNSQTDFALPATGENLPVMGGLDAYDCDQDAYVGVVAGDIGTIRVFHWQEFSPGSWGFTNGDALFIQNESVNAAAIEATQLSQVYVVSSVSAGLYRFIPTSGTFQTIVPQYLGTLPVGYNIRGLSFGPTFSPPSTTTTTTTTSSTTTTTLTPNPQTKGQIKCITKINKDTGKVASTQSGEAAACIQDALAGKLAGTTTPDVDSCLGADRKGKIAKAAGKTIGDETKHCGGANVPDYGYIGPTDANANAVVESLAMYLDVFGVPVSDATNSGLANPVVAKCQVTMASAMERLLGAEMKGFNKCKKVGLSSASIATGPDLADCLDDLGNAATKVGKKVAKARAQMTNTIVKECGSTNFATTFPGVCSASSTASALGGCARARVSCSVCVALSNIDAFAYNCDLYDDGSFNTSCAP